MSTQKSVLQEAGTVEENALRIDQDKAEQLVDALNTDLAATEVLYHQLRKHHWTVHGSEYRDLHLFYEEAYESASEGADHLAERAQALGGVPTSRPADFQERSPVEPEPEDIYDVRTMMENDMEMYGDIIETVREHIELAENLGDYATAELLREQIEELEEFAHEIEHFLEHDSLTEW
ncbi:DNA-binding ferritin-like protein (oxidative damage protectant) [Natronoarchaeum philippinense]|uniref:DNA-binding ferritin-like protein (Oxidative damage protectant) n=1 Tax=Natronoarchaeum philippinense TaxID=558529 RepID=A0A285N751_NATPI|nr:DNA starvation/stationary phase protection protein DpsA [Natronoarchaeum philippinense]SNZ03796.1 DNA-binding ferritin-like protein (oxidative damage protectant) [Natronoarchaeum philippinense]